jgi:hypothetical protein
MKQVVSFSSSLFLITAFALLFTACGRVGTTIPTDTSEISALAFPVSDGTCENEEEPEKTPRLIPCPLDGGCRVPTGDMRFTVRSVHPTTGAENKPHYGVDFPVPVNTPFYAPSDGIIEEIKIQGATGLTKELAENSKVGHGLRLILRHGEDSTAPATLYAHLDPSNFDIPGWATFPREVEKGDLLGVTGKTGSGTGPHLHLEYVRQGGALRIPATGFIPDYIDPFPCISFESFFQRIISTGVIVDFVLDDNGYPTIIERRFINQNYRYYVRRWDGSKWLLMASSQPSDFFVDVTFDPQGNLAVLYIRYTPIPNSNGVASQLYLRRWNGGVHSDIKVDGVETANSDFSLGDGKVVFNANGSIGIVGVVRGLGPSGYTFLARWNGASWAVWNPFFSSSVTQCTGTRRNPDIEITPSGTIIGGGSAPGGPLCRWSGGDVTEYGGIIDSGGISLPLLALAKDGIPYVAYVQYVSVSPTKQKLVVKKLVNSNWVTITEGKLPSEEGGSSVVLNDLDVLTFVVVANGSTKTKNVPFVTFTQTKDGVTELFVKAWDGNANGQTGLQFDKWDKWTKVGGSTPLDDTGFVLAGLSFDKQQDGQQRPLLTRIANLTQTSSSITIERHGVPLSR